MDILIMAVSMSRESCFTAGFPSLKKRVIYLSMLIGSPYLARSVQVHRIYQETHIRQIT